MHVISMLGTDVDVIDSHRDILGESPVWDPRENVLYWVDGIGPAIHRLDPANGSKRSWPMPEEVGAIGLREKRESLVVGLRSGVYFLDTRSGALEAVAKPEADRPENRFNDGKVDRAGRFWSGTIKADRYEARGRLWRIDPDRQAHKILEGIVCPNSICFSPDDRLMYYSESFTCRIDVFDFDITDGAIYNRRLFAEVPLGRGVSDGATVDAEGCLWIANMDGWCVTRYNPRGQIDRVINLPVRRPSACCFGGPDLNILYITTATRRMPEKEIAQQPLAGCLLAVDPGVIGLPEPLFAG